MADDRGIKSVALNAKVTLPDGKTMVKSDLMKLLSIPDAKADSWLIVCTCNTKCPNYLSTFNANTLLPSGVTVAEAAQLLKAGVVKESVFPADQLKAIRSV